MPKLNLLNELQFLLRNLAATPVPLLCPFSCSFFPVQCMMFKATYSPADANNKRKETKWAVFSLCKMSVEMDGLKEPDSSLTGQPVHLGLLVGVLPRWPRASAPPPASGLKHSIKVGIRGRRPSAHQWSPESQTEDLPLPHCFPSGVSRPCCFHSAFVLFQGCS